MTKTIQTESSPDKVAKPAKASPLPLTEAELDKVQAGGVTFQDFHFVKRMDKSSPG